MIFIASRQFAVKVPGTRKRTQERKQACFYTFKDDPYHLRDDLTHADFIYGVRWGIYRRTHGFFWLALRVPSLVIYAVTLLHMYGNLIINGRQGT